MNKPTLQEKEEAIQFVLSQGLQQPEGIGTFFMRMYRALGFKSIFYNLYQVIALSIVMVLGSILFLSVNIADYKYTTIFLLSPLSFVMIVSVTEWMERSHPLYELKMTFKYTVKDMVIFRTLCYSLVSIFISVILSLGMRNVLDILRATSIAFSALFLCTLLTVAITRRFNYRLTYLTSFGVWSVVNLVPLLLFGSRWEALLSKIPLGITLIISAVLTYLYVEELKQFIHMKDREVEYDVAG